MRSSGILTLAASHGPLEAGQQAGHLYTLPALVTWQPLCPKVSGISFRQLLTQRSKALMHVPSKPLGGMFCTIKSPGRQQSLFISLLSSEDPGEQPRCLQQSRLRKPPVQARRNVFWRGQSIPNPALLRTRGPLCYEPPHTVHRLLREGRVSLWPKIKLPGATGLPVANLLP